MKNIDKKVADDFGAEWEKYDQSALDENQLKIAWNQYFKIFPFNKLVSNAEGFDMGCGSGRWAKFVAPLVGKLNCIDPSVRALNVAKKNLFEFENISFINASVSDDMLPFESQDFGYCLGVLHHIPDTKKGIESCAKALKKGAPFLLYLYYNFENRSFVFKFIWKITDFIRKIISSLPSKLKMLVCYLIALFIYYPLARISLIFTKLKINPKFMPLSDYKDKKFYFMKTDALDRFGTSLEKRFSRQEITEMLENAGFENINFSNEMPYWVCISSKKF
tara:strand:+ start:758 stop:1588 length:831 start_codon:yes stop_codon:yes gene_type:complete